MIAQKATAIRVCVCVISVQTAAIRLNLTGFCAFIVRVEISAGKSEGDSVQCFEHRRYSDDNNI